MFQETQANDNLDSLAMSRTWENSNHPYLFFNEDGATFTPLGFKVRGSTSIII